MNIHFRNFLTLILFFLATASAHAVIAKPGLMTITQADGSQIQTQMVGDEWAHLMLTSDGYPISLNKATGNYEYISLDANGKSRLSAITVTEPAKRSARALTFLNAIDRKEVLRRFDSLMVNAPERAKTAYFVRNTSNSNDGKRRVRSTYPPTTGHQKVLILLVDFPDVNFQGTTNAESRSFRGMDDPTDFYQRFFNEQGFSDNGASGSAYDYYREASRGLYNPTFDVYGPITMDSTFAHYGGTRGTEDAYQMVIEAVQKADKLYDINFADYDNNNDGQVDNVYIIYAGYGRADSRVRNVIWPHSYDLASAGDATVYLDGKVINRYACSQEINGSTTHPVGIGTFVHEFAHVLGLADHYNTQNSGAKNQPGSWDVMASGNYANNQNTPVMMSAFERISLGWLQPPVLDIHTDTVMSLKPYEDNADCWRVRIGTLSNEYYLIENRQRKGWDAYLPGHGMLVWHIDEQQRYWSANAVNTNPDHQHVDIVEASGLQSTSGSAFDTFPGQGNITSKIFNSWIGNFVFGFDWVNERRDSVVDYLLSYTGYRLNTPQGLKADSITGSAARIVWQPVDKASHYTLEIFNSDGERVDSVSVDGTTFIEKKLNPFTTYTATLTARLPTLSSPSTSITFTTTEAQIEERRITALPATNVTSNSFTARWNDDSEATEYEITLLDNEKVAPTNYGTGFDDYTEENPVLPDGWYQTAVASPAYQSYGNSAPAYALRTDSMSLYATIPGEKIYGASFWNRVVGGAALNVSVYQNGEWTLLMSRHAIFSSGGQANYTFDGADSLRFTLIKDQGVTNSYASIDDVQLIYRSYTLTPLRTITVSADLVRQQARQHGLSGCALALSDLDTNKYAYIVRAKLGDRESQRSDTIVVDLNSATAINAIRGKQATDNSAIYDLQGRRVGTMTTEGPRSVNGNALATGIYITDGRKFIIK